MNSNIDDSETDLTKALEAQLRSFYANLLWLFIYMTVHCTQCTAYYLQIKPVYTWLEPRYVNMLLDSNQINFWKLLIDCA